jgi:hypothetical protein
VSVRGVRPLPPSSHAYLFALRLSRFPVNGRLIRDDHGRVFRVPYGRADCPSFSVDWIGPDGGWRVVVFPGLERRPDGAVARKAPKVATA